MMHHSNVLAGSWVFTLHAIHLAGLLFIIAVDFRLVASTGECHTPPPSHVHHYDFSAKLLSQLLFYNLSFKRQSNRFSEPLFDSTTNDHVLQANKDAAEEMRDR